MARRRDCGWAGHDDVHRLSRTAPLPADRLGTTNAPAKAAPPPPEQPCLARLPAAGRPLLRHDGAPTASLRGHRAVGLPVPVLDAVVPRAGPPEVCATRPAAVLAFRRHPMRVLRVRLAHARRVPRATRRRSVCGRSHGHHQSPCHDGRGHCAPESGEHASPFVDRIAEHAGPPPAAAPGLTGGRGAVTMVSEQTRRVRYMRTQARSRGRR